jgi:hypothetical protein
MADEQAADWFIDVRASGRGGPVGTIKFGDGNRFFPDAKGLLQEISGRDVLIVTHGFENDRVDGTKKINEWKRHLEIPNMPVVIGFLWPGDCIIPLCLDYIWEGTEAMKSGTLLGDFIDQNFGAAASVSFASHSLGARVVLQAISRLSRSVRNLFLMAPAIEDDCLTVEYAAITANVDRISVVYSHQDKVLKMAYPAGNLIGGMVERSDPNIKVALGRGGAYPTPIPTNVLGNPALPDAWEYGHTDYMTTSATDGDFPQQVVIPAPTSAVPPLPEGLTPNTWKPCWSAGLATTRWLLP